MLEELTNSVDLKTPVLVANAVAEVVSREAGVTGPVGQPDPA